MKPVILTHKSNYEGCVFSRMHTFSSGHKAPIYDIHSTGALNQIIGHVKFANAQYGNVYYRGVNGLYDNVLPALMRNRTNGSANDLNKILNEINNSEYFKESLKLRHTKYPKAHEDHYLNQAIKRHNKYTVEALLQHYAGSTRFLDVVDNHWVALWVSIRRNAYCGGQRCSLLLHKKGKLMITREEILSIEEYCAEHKISHKKRLEELGIPFWSFYKAKQKYRRADEQDAQPGQFVQLASGRYVPQTMPPARTAGKSGKPVKPTEENNESYLTVELQTRTGTAMRIQGVMTPSHLRELIAAGNV